jgi:hypothetical protein
MKASGNHSSADRRWAGQASCSLCQQHRTHMSESAVMVLHACGSMPSRPLLDTYLRAGVPENLDVTLDGKPCLGRGAKAL